MELWGGWWMITMFWNSFNHTTYLFNEPWNCSNHALFTKYFYSALKVQEILVIWTRVQLRRFPLLLISISSESNFGEVFIFFIWSYTSAPGGVPWLHDCGINARNIAKYNFWKRRRSANVTNEKAPQWTLKKTYLVAFLGHSDAPMQLR